MIHVAKAPEPSDFDKKVRQPGNKWLSEHPESNGSDANPYWSKCKDDMIRLYGPFCVYTTLRKWSRELSVDHFVPKTADKSLIYEWDNYRLCSLAVNLIKNNLQQDKILDPFTLPERAYVLKLPSCRIEVNKSVLIGENYNKADYTLNRLRINDTDLCEVRKQLLFSKDIDFIRSQSHFMADEIERQGYIFNENEISTESFVDD